MSSFSDSSLEFDLYESMRLKLARLLGKSMGDEVRAGRVALYVMQGVREVPGLLNALASGETSEEETLALLDSVLGGAATLERARALLDDALADD